MMDTPMEEQQLFLNVTSNIAASEPAITEPNMLSVIFLNHVCNLEFREWGTNSAFFMIPIYANFMWVIDTYLTIFVSFFWQVEAEVVRLEQLKSSKMKELVIKKRLELEEICRRIHMVTETLSIMEDSVEAMESGKNFINASNF